MSGFHEKVHVKVSDADKKGVSNTVAGHCGDVSFVGGEDSSEQCSTGR